VREFTMAEIEHFVDPQNKRHSKFKNVKDMKLPLFSKQNQVTVQREVIRDMTLEDAVQSGTIDNETLAYFLARSYLFLKACGIREDGIRFR
jgi:glycyl-tRNA synthetase